MEIIQDFRCNRRYMPPIPLEIFTMLGGAVTGFIFKFMAERAKERQAQFEMFIKTIQAKDDSADRAATREKGEAGRWVRRLIVMSVLFGVILAPFVLALMDKPVIVQVDTPIKEHFFGLWSTGGKTAFYQLHSYLLVPEVRQALTAIIGYYFGNASASKR